jgi:hypothetical protein
MRVIQVAGRTRLRNKHCRSPVESGSLDSMRSLLILLLLSGTASAHIALTYPPARTVDQKAGPCGATGSKRGKKVTTFAPGATIRVEWDETTDHPGHYRIAFDDDGDDVFVNPNNPSDNFAFTLEEPIADKVGGHYTQTITLPSKPCANCTLQLMQIMTTAVPYNSFYYQCADIAIGQGGTGVDPDPDPDPEPEGAGCSTHSGGGAGALVLVIGLLALASRTRRIGCCRQARRPAAMARRRPGCEPARQETRPFRRRLPRPACRRRATCRRRESRARAACRRETAVRPARVATRRRRPRAEPPAHR